MLKTAIVGLTALLVTGSTLAYSQTTGTGPAKEILNSVDWKALTDARIEIVKAALQLTPEQEKFWPAIEDAIRAKAEARHSRLEAMTTPRTEPRDALELLNDHADNMAKRAAGLKKLAEAWQPLYQTLDAKQKQRLRFLAVYVLREMRETVENRHMQHESDDDGDE